jgi:hypothetical protein
MAIATSTILTPANAVLAMAMPTNRSADLQVGSKDVDEG